VCSWCGVRAQLECERLLLAIHFSNIKGHKRKQGEEDDEEEEEGQQQQQQQTPLVRTTRR
jgi:hypothetical protein